MNRHSLDAPLSGRVHMTASLYPWEKPVSTPVVPVAPVESKVKVATIGAYLGGVVGLALIQGLSDGSVLALLPAPYATFLAPLVPAAVAFVTAYLAKHTPRSSGLGDDVDAAVKAKAAEAVAAALAEARLHFDPATNTVTVAQESQS